METLLAVLLFVLLWWWLAQRRWFADRRRGPGTAVTPTSTVGPDRNQAKCARSLARMWSRELIRSAAFATGIALLVMSYLLFALLYSQETDSWAETFNSTSWFAHVLVGMTVIAAHRAATRGHREDVAELTGTCPLSEEVRSIGHLGSVIVPVVAFTIFVIAYVQTKEQRGFGSVGPIVPGWLNLVAAFVLILGGVALGVALGRWVRFQVAPVLALLVVLFVSLGLSTTGDPGWNPYTQLSTAPPFEDVGELLAPRPYGWHLVWLLGLTAITTVIALAWSRRDRWIVAAMAAAIVVTIAGGIGATRGLSSADADQIVAMIVSPEVHQTCQRSESGALDICVYGGFDETVPVLMGADHVASTVPGSGRFVIRQGLLDVFVDQLPPEVRDRLPSNRTRPANELVVGLDPPADDGPGRLALAFHAVGLPTEGPADGVPLVVVGQSRSVVALWLSTVGLSDQEALALLTPDGEAGDDPLNRSAVWAGVCFVPPAVTSIEELVLARELATGDDARVAEIITSDWDRWVDPATGTAELVDALGLDGPTSFSPIEPHPYDSGC